MSSHGLCFGCQREESKMPMLMMPTKTVNLSGVMRSFHTCCGHAVFLRCLGSETEGKFVVGTMCISEKYFPAQGFQGLVRRAGRGKERGEVQATVKSVSLGFGFSFSSNSLIDSCKEKIIPVLMWMDN